MTSLWIAWRVIREITRDRRTLAFFFVVPVVVMSLVYYAVSEDEQASVGLLARGAARLFEGDVVRALESEDDLIYVPLSIDDEETDAAVLAHEIDRVLRTGEVDGVLYFTQELLVDRFRGERGTLHLYLEGSRPTLTATVLSGVASAMDDLAAGLPVVIDASCSAFCANSVNVKPMELEKHYLHGSEDYRLIDFFLPVLPPFFVFFFTFILATVTFQRERVQGTLARLLIAPVSFTQVVVGYVGGFLLFSGMQAAIVLGFVLALLSFPVTALQLVDLGVVTLLMLLIGLTLGLLASFLAANEFQALQFIPLVVLPQIFLSDIIWDVGAFPLPLRVLSAVLPLTHANAVMRAVIIRQHNLLDVWPQLLVLVGFIAVILVALAAVSRLPDRSG